MAKYIKNAQATKGAEYYISKVNEALIAHGAVGIQTIYDNGRITALSFALPSISGQGTMAFQLPCNWRKFQQVLLNQNVPRCNDDEYAYKVAWANIKDWIEAQMALYETEMVTMPQVFLPFATTKDGRTLAEVIASDPSRLLGSGENHTTTIKIQRPQ